MKSVVANPHNRVLCLRLETPNGAFYRFTDHPVDLVMGNLEVYASTLGYDFTGYSSPDGFAPASIDVSGILSLAGIPVEKAIGGYLDGARAQIFATTFTDPQEDEEPVVSGIFGKLTIRDDRVEIAVSSLAEALGESVGRTYGAQCPKVFGGQEYAGCTLDLTPYTVTGTVTAVVDTSTVEDSARSEPTGTYEAGTIEFTSGALAGYGVYEVRSFDTGQIEVYDQWPVSPQVGDAYRLIRGCRKRLVDCEDYANVVNFGGFPWIPVSSVYAARGIPPANSG